MTAYATHMTDRAAATLATVIARLLDFVGDDSGQLDVDAAARKVAQVALWAARPGGRRRWGEVTDHDP